MQFCLLLQVGARCLNLGVHGAVDNVKINLKDIKDQDYVKETTEAVNKLVLQADDQCAKVLEILESR